MPLKLNLGLSRKVGEANYSSRGASIHLEVEVDSSLIGAPAKFQRRIRHLFGLVRTSLAEELHGNGKSNGPLVNGNGGASAVNGHSAIVNGAGTPPRPEQTRMATASQLRAIAAIAHRQQIDLLAFLESRVGVNRPEDLTLKQASQVIDELKAASPAGA